MIKNKTDIPEKSGVYLFKSKDDKILYIGKAKNLKKRIEQYFHKQSHFFLRTLFNKSHKVDYILTDNERDALHLEYNLIHKHNPPFNIRLKDDKRFPLIEITTQDGFPGIYYTREVNPKNVTIGPIADTKKTKILIDMITRLFKLRTCSNLILRKKTTCLYFYIDRCSAPCIQKISQKKYLQNAADAIRFLRGRKTIVLEKMQLEMKKNAANLEFEKAQKIKEDIELVKEFSLESYISSKKKVDYDVIALHNHDHDVMLILFSVVDGKIQHREFFFFHSISVHKNVMLKEFLVSFYQTHNLPREIVVPFLPADWQLLETLFQKISQKKIGIRIPRWGNKKMILKLALKNLNTYVWKNQFSLMAQNLKNSLRLSRLPNHIEGIDISHMSERERVGAVVVYKSGKPIKSMYRNYIIKKAGSGDIEALREVLERRFKKEGSNPDLILIDGGSGQLNMSEKVKQQLSITADIISIAKREERIFLENGGSIIFPNDSPEKFLFQNIRDEVHRRAKQYHIKKRENILTKVKKKS